MNAPESANRERALVVMPTYNERENLPQIVPAILAQAAELDVLVVDDNSPDGTGQLADELARASPARVSVLHRAKKQGLGPAYLEGFAKALALGYGRILQMDADFSHDPSRLPALLAASREGDLGLGSRYVPGGGTRNWGLGRRVLSRGGSIYARTILGIKISDLTGAFRCYRREVLEALDLGTVTSTGYAFQIELIYRVVCRGFRVVEVPFVFVDRFAGKSKMTSSIIAEAVWRVWQVRFSKAARGNGAVRR
jgi:dolichol-phosphate mannosyltransferase